MTSMPPGDALTLDAPLDPQLLTWIESDGLAAVIGEVTRPARLRLARHADAPVATESLPAYAAWLRRQVTPWIEAQLPAVQVAASDWPLESVSTHCLDVVGLLIADLRELAPRSRPTLVPARATAPEPAQPGVLVGTAATCVALAASPARLLGSARALTAHMTRTGSATRYLARCAALAERAQAIQADVNRWAGRAGHVQAELAVSTARRLTDHLADELDARARTCW